MWKRYSMMGEHRGSKWAWLLSALVVVFGAIIYASDRYAGADVEVGENRCFPVHWCIPGTTGESPINTDGDVEMREGGCFPAHWCIPGTTRESAIDQTGSSKT